MYALERIEWNHDIKKDKIKDYVHLLYNIRIILSVWIWFWIFKFVLFLLCLKIETITNSNSTKHANLNQVKKSFKIRSHGFLRDDFHYVRYKEKAQCKARCKM